MMKFFQDLSKDGSKSLPAGNAGALKVEAYLSRETIAESDPLPDIMQGFDIRLIPAELGQEIPSEAGADILIIELRKDDPVSVARFRNCLSQNSCVIAALSNPLLADARTLIAQGAADVLSVPLSRVEVEAALRGITTERAPASDVQSHRGSMIAGIKSKGGVGATTLLTQVAATLAADAANKVCFVDLDIQFGSAALYLGQAAVVGIKDLLAAGARADSSLREAAIVRHHSGLHLLGAPPEILPLDWITSDQVMQTVDALTKSYDFVFVDLPQSWTDWSVSILARSELVLLVCELSVASLQHAKRQMSFLSEHEIGVRVEVVMNKVERKLFKQLDLKDAGAALGRDILYAIANDEEGVKAALNQGMLVSELGRRGRLSVDLKKLAQAIPALLERAD
jgi:pilus assembly protein CpaE